MMMRTLVTALAVITALGTPTFAQGRLQVPPRNPDMSGYGSFAQVQPRKPDLSGYGSFGTLGPPIVHRSPYSVYSTDGNYIGADPDPRVRDQLLRDQSQGGGR
jgi:hypothetical protein